MSLIPSRWPLATQVLLRLLLNLLLVGGAFATVVVLQGRLNPAWMLAGRAGERLQTVAVLIAGDLSFSPDGEESSIVERYREVYHHDFLLFDPVGRLLTPTQLAIPGELLAEVTRPRRLGIETVPGPPSQNPPPGGLGREGDPSGPDRGGRRRQRMGLGNPGPGADIGPPGAERGPDPMHRGLDAEIRGGRGGPPRGAMRIGPAPRAVLRVGSPPAYWIVLPLPPHRNGPGFTLVVRSETLWSGGLLLDGRPWLFAGLGALALSVLFWLPFVRAITGDIARMTRTTAEIAAGRFETRLDLPRRDELGRLASSIDGMAARLSSHVAGQKRFLGDAAHELCTPLARMQAAVAILETRTPESDQAYLRDLREELDEMAALVGEFLSFSRATHGRPVAREAVDLRGIAARAWNREGDGTIPFLNDIPTGLQALGDAALLQRALANLLRNAIRYAGKAGPITVSARAENPHVLLTVADEGPGVPPETLSRLFEPFFRPEPSRARELGGAGLGLAIVKTCADACGGTVEARNRSPRGFAVTIQLSPVDKPTPVSPI